MELTIKNGFSELSYDEMLMIDGDWSWSEFGKSTVTGAVGGAVGGAVTYAVGELWDCIF